MATGTSRTRLMSTEKTTIAALALTLVLSLLGAIFTPHPAVAAPDEVKWSRVSIPTDGRTGDWVLANGSDVQHLTMAGDGTLYAHANPSGTSYTLFKSTDAGRSWSHTGKVSDSIVAIAAASDDANVIYYATPSRVYASADAGSNFTLLPPNPGGAGSDNITITSLDVARLDGNSIIAVGTRDGDSGQYGGVYILEENRAFTWIDTNIGSYDVCTVAFSPNFITDRLLVAVVTDETDSIIAARIHDDDWGRVFGNATIAGQTPISATVAFPDDYDATNADYTLFLALDSGTGSGDVYTVKGAWAPGISMVTDLDIGYAYDLYSVDVTGLAVSGDTGAGHLLAGTANSTEVYISTDNGMNWTRSIKKPTGQAKTRLLMAPDFAGSGTAYAATTGTESAFSYSIDGGSTWHQVGLIDTKISANGIIDLAVSPGYGQDNTLFMLTFDAEHTENSLWRSLDGAAEWERIFASTLADADTIDLVELSPQYGSASQTVFLVGTSGSSPAIWKSTDNGQTFVHRAAPLAIDTAVAVNDSTLILGGYDGGNGLVYRTTNSGLSYSTRVEAGSKSLESIALSPNYGQDETILVGNANGRVYWSDDNGASFETLGQQLAASSAALDRITVAFDPEFGSNGAVYAISDEEATTTSRQRIYRFIIGRSETWESVDSTLPVGSVLGELAVSTDGTLYAINSQSVNAANGEGGLERSLNPTYPLGPTFETVTRGLDDGATLAGLWLSGNQLWSIDTTNTRLMTYTDSLAQSVTLTSPPDEAPGIATGNASLDWQTLSGATKHQWQLDYDTNFSTIPSGFEGDTTDSAVRLTALDAATTYYWRVRATEPVLSRWSAKWSFTTSLGTAAVTPELYSPKAGASGTSIRPVFQWSAIAGADSYELLVSTDAAFASPVVVRIGDYALPATAWQSDVGLEYDTTYYWKVRASSASSYGDWSAVGAFTTASLPSPSAAVEPTSATPTAAPPTPPAASTPTASPTPAAAPAAAPLPPPPSPPSTQSGVPDWLAYVAIALLLTTVLLLITLLVLVAGIRRP